MADITTFMRQKSRNLEASTFLTPQGLSRPARDFFTFFVSFVLFDVYYDCFASQPTSTTMKGRYN